MTPHSSLALAPVHPLLQAYSEQVLQWQLGQAGAAPAPFPCEDASRAQQAAARVMASAARAGHSHVLVLGLGDGTLASLVWQGLPAECTLLVLEDQPPVARAVLGQRPDLRPYVLVDTSPWALFLLCQALGVPSQQCSLCFNPVYARKSPTGLPVLEQWRRLFLGAQAFRLPESDVCRARNISVASSVPSTQTTRTGPSGQTTQTGPSGQTARTGPLGHTTQTGPSGQTTRTGPLGPSGSVQSGIGPFSTSPSEAAQSGAQARLSVACIAHPDEALLPEFFSHIPAWVHEVVVVWDGHPPASLPPCAAPLRQAVRPLNGNFAAQRNTMLEHCTGEWCLYLDVDERLDAATWAAIPAWLTLPTVGPDAVGGIVLPRLTFMGDAAHVRMGYGLWPDVQMRLFPLPTGERTVAGQGGPHFVGAVHEQLTGLHGATLLVGGYAIWHYSHIRKDAATLQERLQVFNAAAGERIEGFAGTGEGAGPLAEAAAAKTAGPCHVLSAAYPRLPLAYFTDLLGLFRPQEHTTSQRGAWDCASGAGCEDCADCGARGAGGNCGDVGHFGHGAWLLPL